MNGEVRMNRFVALVQPLGPWSVRDGRPFDAGTPSFARGAEVSPATICGAVTAAIPKVAGKTVHPRQVVGPIIAEDAPWGLVPFFPTPLDVVQEDEWAEISRLQWRQRPFCSDLAVDRFPELTGPGGLGVPCGGWLGSADLESYLSAGSAELHPRHDLVVEESRVQIQPGEEHMFARHEVRRFTSNELCFAAVVTLPDEAEQPEPQVIPFGGEGGEATVRWLSDEGVVDSLLPGPPDLGDELDVLVYLMTPAAFPSTGWVPPLPHGVELRAATTSGPVAVASGRPGQWRLVWCVGPGSLFHLRFTDEALRDAFVTPGEETLRAGTFKQAHHDMRSAGFGAYLIGRVPSS